MALVTKPGKNALGLGAYATAGLLGALFFGTYFGSSYLTKRWIMQRTESPDPPKYFRDIKLTDDSSK